MNSDIIGSRILALLLALTAGVAWSEVRLLPEPPPLGPADQAFLETLSRRAFLFFWEQAEPRTGLVRDRSRPDGASYGPGHAFVGSVAATGFGLTALCIAAERGWVSRDAARERVRATLRFVAARLPHVNGWYYHFVDVRTGLRAWNSEVSSIDTALLLAGVLTARQAFADDPELVRLGRGIYDRVDFRWMLAGHRTLLSHGWRPETGFIPSRWDTCSEHALLYLLALGSRTSALPPGSWTAWRRPSVSFGPWRFFSGAPLFSHQYSHAWVDFRGLRETRPPHTDWFANSAAATRAHRAFCASLAGEFPAYSRDLWGITASDGPRGYIAWGGPPRDPTIDGTVVPCAAGGSLMLAPDVALPALRTMRRRFGDRVWGRYGFVDAFHPTSGWNSNSVLGIDQGITLLSAENLRSGLVWRLFMRNPEPRLALTRAGFERWN